MKLAIALLFVMVAVANCHGPPKAIKAKLIRHKIKQAICDGKGPDFSKVVDRIKEAVNRTGVDPETIKQEIKERIENHLEKHGIDPEEVKERVREHMKEHLKNAPPFVKAIHEKLKAQNKTLPPVVKAKIIRAHIRAHLCGVSIREQIREKICSGDGPDFSKVIAAIKQRINDSGADPQELREKIKDRIAEHMKQHGVDPEKVKQNIIDHWKEHAKNAPPAFQVLRKVLAARNKTIPLPVVARIIRAHARAHLCNDDEDEDAREDWRSKLREHLQDKFEDRFGGDGPDFKGPPPFVMLKAAHKMFDLVDALTSMVRCSTGMCRLASVTMRQRMRPSPIRPVPINRPKPMPFDGPKPMPFKKQ